MTPDGESLAAAVLTCHERLLGCLAEQRYEAAVSAERERDGALRSLLEAATTAQQRCEVAALLRRLVEEDRASAALAVRAHAQTLAELRGLRLGRAASGAYGE